MSALDSLGPGQQAALYCELTGEEVLRIAKDRVRQALETWIAIQADMDKERVFVRRGRKSKFNLSPGPRIHRVRPGGLMDRLIGLLRRGATFEALMAAIDRGPKATHDLVRLVNRRFGYRLVEGEDGVIRAVTPKGREPR